MINVVIMEPFNATDDPIKLEPQTFWNRAAADVFSGTFDGDTVEFPGSEAVSDHCPAARRHDPLSLMCFVQPIA